ARSVSGYCWVTPQGSTIFWPPRRSSGFGKWWGRADGGRQRSGTHGRTHGETPEGVEGEGPGRPVPRAEHLGGGDGGGARPADAGATDGPPADGSDGVQLLHRARSAVQHRQHGVASV